ncbi:ganglioside-induced differentiation-associated protein 1-like [Anarhichas minor]|uniref:ganglioside-induced differentiation-associated protein 1-like n=1 Tax=Anarhichas minor TaxID=65739 RepID=UPI003F736307
MASENRPESQDEKTALIEKDPEQDVRLAIAEEGLLCEQYDVSLPLSEHNEPWFMHLNPTGEVPVLVHNEDIICDPTQIMDYLEQSFNDEGTPKLIPEEGSTYYLRVQRYRELLDSLQMDAYTHGCILHPEITMDSHIPAYAATCIRKEGSQSWLCGDFFSMADVSLAVTLHRLKFLGLSRRFWGDGNRVNLETYYERVVERPAFRRLLGHVDNILISAVLCGVSRGQEERTGYSWHHPVDSAFLFSGLSPVLDRWDLPVAVFPFNIIIVLYVLCTGPDNPYFPHHPATPPGLPEHNGTELIAVELRRSNV